MRQLGEAEITPSKAAFLSAYIHIDEHHYLGEQTESVAELVKQARTGLVWGRSLTCSVREDPFIEPLTLYENAVNRASAEYKKRDSYWRKNFEQKMLDPQHRAWTQAKVREWKRDKRRQSKEGDAPSTVSRRKRMKNRTRDERIADLRQALMKGGG